ncbi:hypothetical protein SAMN05421812_101751 [Asanoa hainanensis]|uniref:Probable membrane transporter protein n=2 Tax=Asanoa hainanensis TaxID=560556 RepID=A0A239H9M0_9ACTN|nr:hypothetical protein SAMN05421812_101751 [Asanoa hainanensis]
MAVAAVMGNVGRVVAWWRRIEWAPVLAYALPGVPAAALGAHTLLAVPPRLVDGCLAVFFLAMVPLRRFAALGRLRLRHLAAAGAVVGFLTGLVLSTGPLSVPVFSAYGLSGGAFLGSEAASALLLFASKLATFVSAGALGTDVLLRGAVIGAALIAGSFVARRIVRDVSPRRFEVLVDAVLVVAAVSMCISAAR